MLILTIAVLILIALELWFNQRSMHRGEDLFQEHQSQQCLITSQILHHHLALLALEAQYLSSQNLPLLLKERILIAPVSTDFQNMLKTREDMLAITITDGAGRLIYARGKETAQGSQAVNISLSWAKDHLEEALGAQNFFIPPLWTESPLAWGLIVPVKLDNEAAGLLVLVMDAAKLYPQLSASTQTGPEEHFFVIDSQGTILSHPDPSMLGKNLMDAMPGADTSRKKLYEYILREPRGMDSSKLRSGLRAYISGKPSRQIATWQALSVGGQRLCVVINTPYSSPGPEGYRLLMLILPLIMLAGIIVYLVHLRRIRVNKPIRTATEQQGGPQDEQLQRILDLSPAGIARYDLDLHIIAVNNRLAQIMGTRPELLLGYDLHENYDPRILDAFSGALQDRQTLYEGEFLPARDSRTIFIRAACAPIHAPDQSILGGIAVVEDISQRKQHEEDRIRLHNLESISILTSGIAHDFNNILALILGNVILAREYLPGDSRCLEKLDKCEHAVEQARKLMHRMLSYSSNTPSSLQQCKLEEFILDTVRFHFSGSNIRPEIVLAEGLGDIICDPNQIGQVLGSIIANAKEAMPKGGIVHINVQRVQIEPGEIPPLEAGNYVRIIIQDYGHGIPHELLPRIFDPYFSTKGASGRQNAGLGLTTARTIIRQHEGHIAADSVEGMGATITIWLPLY